MTGKKKNQTTEKKVPPSSAKQAGPITIPEELVNEVARFMEYTEPRRLSRNLRGLLLSMLIAQKDGYCFDLDDLLTDLTFLFNLLDTMEDTVV